MVCCVGKGISPWRETFSVRCISQPSFICVDLPGKNTKIKHSKELKAMHASSYTCMPQHTCRKTEDRTRHQKKLVWLIFVLSKLCADSIPLHPETTSISCKISQGKISRISHILISEDRATVILYARFYIYSYLLFNRSFTSR